MQPLRQSCSRIRASFIGRAIASAFLGALLAAVSLGSDIPASRPLRLGSSPGFAFAFAGNRNSFRNPRDRSGCAGFGTFRGDVVHDHQPPPGSTSTATAVTMAAANANDDGGGGGGGVRVLGICGGIGSGKSTACKLLLESLPSNASGGENATAGTSRYRCIAHIDADKVAHSVYAPGSRCIADVVSGFGRSILVVDDEGDGDDDAESGGNGNNATTTTTTTTTPMEIDRKKLGSIVFSDRSELAKLEAIVWPHVKDRLVERIDALIDAWKTERDNNDDNDATTTTTTTGEETPPPIVVPIIVLEAAVLLDAGWDDLLDGVWMVTASRAVALQRLTDTRGLTEAEATQRMDAQKSRRGMSPTDLERELRRGSVHRVVSNDAGPSDLQRSLVRALDDPSCWRNPPPPPRARAVV